MLQLVSFIHIAYADDTQIYGFCRPSEVNDLSRRESDCIDEVSAWMKVNRLQLNPSKTEVFWCSSTRRQSSSNRQHISLAGVFSPGSWCLPRRRRHHEDPRHLCRPIVFRGTSTDPQRTTFSTTTRPSDSDPRAGDQQGRLLLLSLGRYFRPRSQ